MNPQYPNPIEYVRSGDYKSIVLPVLSDDQRIGGLEKELRKVIVGYVMFAIEVRQDEISNPYGIPYNPVQQLIFEYLKHTKRESEILGFLEKKIRALATRTRFDSTRDPRDQSLLDNFKELRFRDISEIEYQQFQPKQYTITRWVEDPFTTYCKRIIGSLVKSSILKHYREASPKGWIRTLRVNPKAQI